MLDSSQIASGVAVLLSFFVGYKYGIKFTSGEDDECEKRNKPSTSSDEKMGKVFFDCSGDYKMILVVRNDLKMGKGKIGAQCAHAAVGAFESALKKIPHILRKWQNSGSAKIAVKVESEAELMEIRRIAIQNNLNVCLIRDAGRTQIEPNTKTVLAIGPALAKDIDRITGHLKLL